LLKLLFNIFIVYAIWQVLRMIFTVRKVQNDIYRNMSNLNDRAGWEPEKKKSPPKRPFDNEGEYVDYEEIK
jgi:hypothetical protein